MAAKYKLEVPITGLALDYDQVNKMLALYGFNKNGLETKHDEKTGNKMVGFLLETEQSDTWYGLLASVRRLYPTARLVERQ